MIIIAVQLLDDGTKATIKQYARFNEKQLHKIIASDHMVLSLNQSASVCEVHMHTE